MADVTALSEIDEAAVQQNLSLLAGMLQDEFPSLDLTASSVFTQLVLRPAAVFHTLSQTNLARERQSNSLVKIRDNPTLADPTTVDRILSNYGVTRREGGTAVGRVTVIVDNNSHLPIGSSVTFTANGAAYRPIRGFAGYPDDTFVADPDADLVFVARTNGTFAIAIDLTANEPGGQANVPKGTRFTVSPTLPGVIDVLAAEEFTGGSDAETTQQLIDRLTDGITAKTPASRVGLRGLLREQFPGVVDVSVIGAGDAEMTRSSHNTLGAKVNGYADVYVRTRNRPVTVTTTRNATLQNVAAGTWLMQFDRDTYPGLYRVATLPADAPEGFGELEVLSQTRTPNRDPIDGLDFTPSMTDDTEGFFTRYQTVAVLFKDPSTQLSLAVGTVKAFQVLVTYMPDLAEVSDWLTARDRRHYGGDYLVRAPIPCFVAVGMKVIQGAGDPELTDDQLQSLKSAVADAVNGVDFAEGRLDAAVIVDAAQSVLPRRTRIQLPLDLRGQVMLPDGSDDWLIDRYSLVAPDRPELMCSPRTMAFYLDPTSISVTAVPTSAPPV